MKCLPCCEFCTVKISRMAAYLSVFGNPDLVAELARRGLSRVDIGNFALSIRHRALTDLYFPVVDSRRARHPEAQIQALALLYRLDVVLDLHDETAGRQSLLDVDRLQHVIVRSAPDARLVVRVRVICRGPVPMISWFRVRNWHEHNVMGVIGVPLNCHWVPPQGTMVGCTLMTGWPMEEYDSFFSNGQVILCCLYIPYAYVIVCCCCFP